MSHIPKIIQLTLALGVMTLIGFLSPEQVGATDARNFNPSRIIDDGIFTNSSTMSVQDIQNFLNSKVTCDTWGTKTSELGEGTRRQWMANRGIYPPFRCMTDYYENPSTKENNYSKNDRPAGSISAAQIIYNYSKQFNINPQVIIATLQKENGMITDEWPTPKQFTEAMGFGCPDNVAPGAPACDPTYKSFASQIYQAARHFRGYIENGPGWYVPYNTGNNSILWNPNQSCGSSTVDIENRATVALYSYTPYRPNQAALNAQYGLGDGCSAYGNRNFYLYFSDWFGSTIAFNGNITLSKNLTINKDSSSVYRGDTITASYEVSNSADHSVLAGGLGICGRLNGQWYDFGYKDQNAIAANGKITVAFTKTINNAGTLSLFLCSYHASIGGWASAVYPYNGLGTVRALNIGVKDNPQLTTNVSLSNTNPYAGENVTATFTIKNNSTQSVNIGRMVLSTRDSHNNNVDFPSDITSDGTVIPAGGTYTFTKSRVFTMSGKHTFKLMNRDTSGWSSSYPSSASTAITRTGTFTVKDNPILTTNVTLTPAKPVAGEPVTATISVRNLSTTTAADAGRLVFSVRDSSGKNYDFPSSILNIPAGQTVTYSQTRAFDKNGSYSYKLVNNYAGKWVSNFPSLQSSDIQTSGSLKVASNPAITSFTIQSSVVNETDTQITGTMLIKNTSAQPINVGRLVFATRDPNGNNVDLPSTGDITIPANSTYTHTSSRTFSQSGTYKMFIASRLNGSWSMTYPSSLDGVNRTQNFTID